jgi:hypothetical protein
VFIWGGEEAACCSATALRVTMATGGTMACSAVVHSTCPPVGRSTRQLRQERTTSHHWWPRTTAIIQHSGGMARMRRH